jgi:hypothetical protein
MDREVAARYRRVALRFLHFLWPCFFLHFFFGVVGAGAAGVAAVGSGSTSSQLVKESTPDWSV